jgi:hypothetical protein
MKESIVKVRKSRISTGSHCAVRRGRVHRFAKWAEEVYGISWISMYDKLKKNRVKTWEGAGIIRCMQEFGFYGSPGDLWQKCVKNKFADYMETKQMSHMTTYRRFGENDFNELELNGISATYRHWRENIDPKRKQ